MDTNSVSGGNVDGHQSDIDSEAIALEGGSPVRQQLEQKRQFNPNGVSFAKSSGGQAVYFLGWF